MFLENFSKLKLRKEEIPLFKTCKDLYSKPAPSYRPLHDSLTALTTELRALFQQQPRNVRISSTLLPGMSELPSPFSSKRPDAFSSPVLSLPYSSTQFSQMSVTSVTLFFQKSWVSPAPMVQNCLIPSSKKIHYQVILSFQFNSCQFLLHKLQSHRGSLP